MPDLESFDQGGGLGAYDPKDIMSLMIINQTPILKPIAPFLMKGIEQGRLNKIGQQAAQGLMQMQSRMDSGDWQGAQNALNQTIPLLGEKGATIGLKYMDLITTKKSQAEAAQAMLEASRAETPEARNQAIFGGKLPGAEALSAFAAMNPQFFQHQGVVQGVSKSTGAPSGPATVIPVAQSITELTSQPGFAAYASQKGVNVADIVNDINSGDPNRVQRATQVTQLLAQQAPQALMQQELQKSAAQQQQILGREKALAQFEAPLKIAVSAAQGQNAANIQLQSKRSETVFERTIGEGIVYDRSTRLPLNPGTPVGQVNQQFQKGQLVRLSPDADKQLTTIRGQRPMFDQLAGVSDEIFKGVKPGENFVNALNLWAQGRTGGSAMVAAFDALQANRLMLGRIVQGSSQGVSDKDVATTAGLVPGKWDSEKSAKARVLIGQRMFDNIEKGLLQEKTTPVAVFIQQLQDLDKSLGITRTLDRNGNLVETKGSEKLTAPGINKLSPGGREVIPD